MSFVPGFPGVPCFALSTEHVPYPSSPLTCASVVSSYAERELFPRVLGQESQESPSPAGCFLLDKSICPFACANSSSVCSQK